MEPKTYVKENERLKFVNGVPVWTYKPSLKRFFIEGTVVTLLFLFIVWIVITR